MLPFDIRANKLLSIHIRAIGLENSNYMLQIVAGDQSYYSAETEHTIVYLE
jgi:hypothetical protein